MPVASKIFCGFRALGYVSNHIPLAVRYHKKHKENYVVTCVGKSFHTYNCSRLGIVSVSDSLPDDISCLAVDWKYVFAACKNNVYAFVRGKQVVHQYEGHEFDVQILLPFGDHLISVDVNSNIKVWDVESEEIYMEMGFDNQVFHITSLVHPSTYLNKVVIGTKQGQMQLWNILRDKLLYTFQGWNSSITVLEQAPAVDIIAVGLADGQTILHNLKYDETVVKFRQDWGPVTCISFRTDGHPVMATGSSAGHIALWDLEERKLKSQMRDAHITSVTGMQCLPSEPLMITSAADNAVKVWIFDLPDGGGRLLRQRSGHSAPPNYLRHYGNNGQNILTAGQDSTLRSFSVVHDKHNKSLGRASYNKSATKKSGLKHDQHMMPPVTQFAAEPSRQSDWDNIVACHRGLSVATTWSYQRSTMGSHKLEHERLKDNPEYKSTVATCTDISSCGNFVVIGYDSGHVDTYNLQSGIFRGSYGDSKAHSNAVRGVAVDGLNQVTITAGADGEIKFWRFKKKNLLETTKLQQSISHICLHRESSMMAVSSDEFTVVIVDIDTRKVVRTFSGHHNAITDMTFSPDARWLITSSMDATVRTWDMPSGRLIDCFLLDSAVTSLSMSPTGDFLVTSHVDDVGVYLWSNMTLYTHVPLKPLPADFEPHLMAMPTSQRSNTDIQEEDGLTEEEEDELTDFKSPEQISDELVTLSLLPNSRWQNLLNLDIIKQRNKPKQPPKAPKSAPFFLQTIPGLVPTFVTPEEDQSDQKKTDLMKFGNLQPLSDIGKQLLQNDPAIFDKIMDRFKECGPSAIDVEIRSLSPDMGGSVKVMCHFLKFIKYILNTKRNFELANAYLGLFLKVHGDTLASEAEIIKELEEMKLIHEESWKHLQYLCTQNLCLVNYLRTATL